MSEPSTNGTIGSVRQALTILERIRDNDGLRVYDLAEELGTSKSTAHRYLKTLHQKNYLVKSGDEYKIGLRFLSFGMHARANQPILTMVQKKIDQVAEETGERVQLMVPEHGKAVYLYRASGDQAVKLNSDVGDRVPLHVVSPGKAILAAWSEEQVEQYLQQSELTQFTENTISKPEQLKTELEQIRERRYSYNKQEFVEEMNAVGVAITDPQDTVLGAIGVSGPTHRMTGSRLEDELPGFLVGAAHEIELNLKHSGEFD